MAVSSDTQPSPGVEAPTGLSASPRQAGYFSDLVVELLASMGCRYVPLNPGSSFRGLHDSLVNHRGNRSPQLLLCLHEEIAVALADGYSKATQSVGVAIVHDLVGLMHASMAVYNAWCDRTSMLILGGGGPADASARRATDWLHSATSQAQLVRQFVKWDAEPISAQDTLEAIARGHQLAGSAPTGPVYVTMDAQVQEQRLVAPPPPLPDGRLINPISGPAADEDQVERAARMLVEADQPVIVGGRVGLDGRATGILIELAETLAAGYCDDRKVAAFPTDHQLSLNGDSRFLAEADVTLAVDLHDLRATMKVPSPHPDSPTPHRARSLISIELDAIAPSSWSHAGQAPLPVDVRIVAEPITGLRQIAAAVSDLVASESSQKKRARAERRVALSGRHQRLRQKQAELVTRVSSATPIHPAHLVSTLWEVVKTTPWLLTLRNNRSWPEGIWQFPGAGSYLGDSGGGGVGYGPGAIVGGGLAARDRGQLPVAIVGDGDLLMAPTAIWTAVHYEIPLLIVVNNNGSFYNDEEHQQIVAGERGRPLENAWIGTRVVDPVVDISGLAHSMGAWVTRPVVHPGALAGALADALRAVGEGRVAVVDVHTAPIPRRSPTPRAAHAVQG